MPGSQSGTAGAPANRTMWESFCHCRLKIAQWIDQARLRGVLHWATVSLRIIVAAIGLIAASGVTIPLAAVILVAILFATVEMAAAGDRDLLRVERDRALESSSQASFDAAGNVRALLKILEDDEAGTLNDDRYGAALESLQRDLLTHIVNQTTSWFSLEAGQVTANWMERRGAQLVLTQNDRNHVHRSLGRTLDIEEELPGAPRAASRHDVELILDTHDPGVASHFDQTKPYRCILSIPVLGQAEDVVGVLNVDSVVPESLDKLASDNILDVAYTVGLCEMLKRRRRPDEH